MLSVELKNLRFTANHGLYHEEAGSGNEFEVSLVVSLKIPKKKAIEFGDTADYTRLYLVVKEEMSNTRPLLESVVESIADRIRELYPAVKQIEVCISKLHPPVRGFNGNVAVRMVREYK